jgi:nitrite reductase/ring-hydroxylating ferredoxin subunit
MSPDPNQVFAICDLKRIGRGEAAPFSLARNCGDGESRPFRIVVVRTHRDSYFGYLSSCPHEGSWLNIDDCEFFTEDGEYLRCGRHGARFEFETGVCVEGECEGKSLERVAVEVFDGDVCVRGVSLVEDDAFPDPFDEGDETMEIMIHPD